MHRLTFKRICSFFFIISLLSIAGLCVNTKDAQASGSAIWYNNTDLKKLGFKNTSFPKKFQGTWYLLGYDEIYKIRIHGGKLTIPAIPLPKLYFVHRTNTFKLKPKPLTIKMLYYNKRNKPVLVKRQRIATYHPDNGLLYMGASGNHLTIGPAYVSSKNPKPHKLVRIMDGEYSAYRTRKQARSHLYS